MFADGATVVEMAPKPLVTQDDLLSLHARYMAGEGSADDLGAEVGYGRNGLTAAFWRAGLPMLGRGPRPMTADHPRAQEAIALWDSGVGVRKINRDQGLSQVTLLRVLRETGRDPSARVRGAGHHQWKGGRYEADGYVRVWVAEDDPMAPMRNSRGYVPEHRLVMARALGRPLTVDEEVHHVDEPKSDNRIENLQLRLGKHGRGHAFACAECGSHNIVAVQLAERS